MTYLATPSGPDGGEGRVIAQKYRLEYLLGEGGMGSIWRAFNLQLEVPVAIKLLRSDLSTAELGERLRVEARAAAKLVHPAIVRVFDIGEAEWGEPFIVMELLHGESLGARLERGALSAVNALQLLLPIAEALSLAHSRGVVHRDLKPDNIFITKDGSNVQPKLLDFGIAKVTSAAACGPASLSQTGTLMGSPDYMSPEQASARPDIDQRSDVWSFCVVLYEAMAGQAPFGGETCQAILRGVLHGEPPSLARLGIDPQLAALVARGLVKDRDARPASIFELGRDLAAWLAAQGVQEDATGSSLEAKWLGRSPETSLLSGMAGASAPGAQHQEATFVSVVNPSPRPAPSSMIELPLRHGPRWLATAAIAAVAVLSGVAWRSFKDLPAVESVESAGVLLPSLQTPARAASPPPAVQLAPSPAAPPPATAIDTLPTQPPLSAPAAGASQQKFSAPTRPAVLRSAPAPGSLPRALPARTRADLINPY